jgi:hypothetical protein
MMSQKKRRLNNPSATSNTPLKAPEGGLRPGAAVSDEASPRATMSELLDGLDQGFGELEAFHRCLLAVGTGKPDGPVLLDALMRRVRRYLDRCEAVESERQALKREELEELQRQLTLSPDTGLTP